MMYFRNKELILRYYEVIIMVGGEGVKSNDTDSNVKLVVFK